MKEPVDRVSELEGPGAPPRQNGELLFEAPWESRVFGLALALADAGHFDFEAFRALLIEEIAAWEAAHPDGEGWSYYSCWGRALQRIAVREGLCPAPELSARRAALAARPAGHDH